MKYNYKTDSQSHEGRISLAKRTPEIDQTSVTFSLLYMSAMTDALGRDRLLARWDTSLEKESCAASLPQFQKFSLSYRDAFPPQLLTFESSLKISAERSAAPADLLDSPKMAGVAYQPHLPPPPPLPPKSASELIRSRDITKLRLACNIFLPSLNGLMA